MMNKFAVVLIASSLSTMSFACAKPDKPELPAVESAVLAQMVKAQKEVKKYLKLSEEYLDCEKNNSRHDRMVKEMKRLGSNFNKLVKHYKEKSQSTS